MGKTSLLLRLTEDRFDPSVTSIGVDFKVKEVKLSGGRAVKLQVWDAVGKSGSKRYTFTSTCMRKAHAILFLYDISDPESWESVPSWISEAEVSAPNALVRLLVGTKCDQDRKVQREQAEELSDSAGLHSFHEVSAATGEGISELFSALATQVDKRLAEHKSFRNVQDTVDLQGSSGQKKRCCA